MDYLPEVIGGDEEIAQETTENSQSPQLTSEDIFDEPKLAMKPIKEEPVKKTRKKRVMTELQKEKLAQARVKALETRRKNSALKKEKKELEKLKKQQEMDELRSSVGKPVKKKVNFVAVDHPIELVVDEHMVEEEEIVKPKQVTKIVHDNNISQKQIEEISMNAIMNYDKIRKNRKVLKEAQ